MKTCKLTKKEREVVLMGSLLPDKPGSLPDAASQAHLAQCAGCSETVASQRRLWTALDTWELPEVSNGFNRALYAKIDAAQNAPCYEKWASVLKPLFAQPSLALGLAAVIIVTGFIFDHPAATVAPVSARPTVQVSTTEAEQVEKTLEDLEMLRQFDPATEEKDSSVKAM